jgi:hypothetical protein
VGVLSSPLLTALSYPLSSPFNYIELVAYISPVVGCFIFMQARLLEYFRDKITEGGPSQIIILAFGIIAIYVNMVSTP